MRYRVLDLPPKGTGAFTPIPTTNPVASSYGLVKPTAALGLVPVSTGSRSWNVEISKDPKTQGSNCAPDVILPDQYIVRADHMGPTHDAGIGMAERRMNPLPVPAISGILKVQNSMHRPKIAGRAAMAWPRSFQRFPLRTNSQGNDQ